VVTDEIDKAAIQVALGANLREARKRAELSQEALGLKIDLHPTEITRIERGRRNPGLVTLVRLARGLGISTADLIDGI
jgi:transcriptional regulator with XRE-family HTH domain